MSGTRPVARGHALRAAASVLLLAALCADAAAAIWYDRASDTFYWRKDISKVRTWDEFRNVPIVGLSLFLGKPPPTLGAAEEDAPPKDLPGEVRSAVYQVDNSSFGVEAGEPLASARMKRTVWRRFVPDRSGRVVVDTYGSTRFGTPLDTLAAAYEVKGPGKGKQLAKNDDTPVAGGEAKASFIQFDVRKGGEYAIQLGDAGDAGDAGGDMLATLTTFTAKGGLVVHPATPYGGYDYLCARSAGQSGACQSAFYVVYNATDQTLSVSASAVGLGEGAVMPAAFQLKPGAAALKTISFTPEFGVDGAATSGSFAFTGRKGRKTVARTSIPARVAIHDGAAAAPELKISAASETLAAPTGGVVPRIVEVENAGPAAATGCYVKPGINEATVQTAWAGYDPDKNSVSTEPYEPFDVAPGDTVPIVVAMRSLRDRLADPAYSRPFEIACASGPLFPSTGLLDLANTVDFSASLKQMAKVSLVKASPASGVLGVGRNGSVLTATFRNEGPAVTLDAKVLERSVHASGGPQRYKLSVCPDTASDAACLASTRPEIRVAAKARKTFTVKVGVRPPVENPGFDPDLIGLALTLTQPYSETIPTPVPVAGVTRALRLR